MNVEAIVLHHTATQGIGDGTAEWKAILRVAQNKRGSSYIGDYHYGIGPTGLVLAGMPTDRVCYHCGSDYWNEHSLAVAVIGNCEKNKMASTQLTSLLTHLRLLLIRYTQAKLMLHKEIAPTLCPGKFFPVRTVMDLMTLGPKFKDISQNDWYRLVVETCVKRGIMKGDPDGFFRPNDPVTRAELAQILDNLLHLEE